MKTFLLTVILGLAAAAQGQTQNILPQIPTNAPRTEFESFALTKDAVLVKGSSIIGTLNSQIDAPLEIRAERVTNPATSNSVYAVSLRTHLEQHVTQVDYIDYDELDAFVQGLTYIAQSTSSVTPLDNFETVIRTRSGLSVAKVGKGNKVTIALTPGYYNATRNQMASFDLDDLARYLTAAKAKIDQIIASGQ